jgi:acetyl-CoA carboxylase biotin carboxylase subunit
VLKGHAIECRINAENPDENFRPSPGIISGLTLPGGNGVRVDTGFCAGDEVSPFYDSLVMKIICTGDDREEAIAMSRAALEELKITGIEHNAEFAKAIMNDKDFISGNVHTKWIEQTFINRYLRSDNATV